MTGRKARVSAASRPVASRADSIDLDLMEPLVAFWGAVDKQGELWLDEIGERGRRTAGHWVLG